MPLSNAHTVSSEAAEVHLLSCVCVCVFVAARMHAYLCVCVCTNSWSYVYAYVSVRMLCTQKFVPADGNVSSISALSPSREGTDRPVMNGFTQGQKIYHGNCVLTDQNIISPLSDYTQVISW